MKKYYPIIIIGIVFCICSCEKTEISLNEKGDLTAFKGTWITADYINKKYYLANKVNENNDITYRDTTVVDSTTLTFNFGSVRADSVQVTAVKIVNKVPQAPVKLAAGRWSFTVGTSTGDEMSGINYFLVYQTDFPQNIFNGYGTSYTYKIITDTRMEIQWVVTSGNAYATVEYAAVLNKQ